MAQTSSLIQQINRTYRASGAVGRGALCPRILTAIAQGRPLDAVNARTIEAFYHYVSAMSGRRQGTVLDFGAGKKAIHTKMLRKYFNVVAYDFGDNIVQGIHDTRALRCAYDVVMASNVLNVQYTRDRLYETITELAMATAPRGWLLANYPKSPRHGGFSVRDVEEMLSLYFMVGNIGKKTTVFLGRRNR